MYIYIIYLFIIYAHVDISIYFKKKFFIRTEKNKYFLEIHAFNQTNIF